MMQYNLGMVLVQHGLVTSNALERQDSFGSALDRLENASDYVELPNVDLVITTLRRALADLDTVTSGEDMLCHLAWSNWRADDLQLAAYRP